MKIINCYEDASGKGEPDRYLIDSKVVDIEVFVANRGYSTYSVELEQAHAIILDKRMGFTLDEDNEEREEEPELQHIKPVSPRAVDVRAYQSGLSTNRYTWDQQAIANDPSKDITYRWWLSQMKSTLGGWWVIRPEQKQK